MHLNCTGKRLSHGIWSSSKKGVGCRIFMTVQLPLASDCHVQIGCPLTGGGMLNFVWQCGCFLSGSAERQCSLGAKNTKDNNIKNKLFGRLSGTLGGDLLYVFFSPKGDDPPKTHINKFLPPTQSQDTPPNLFMFMCF